jgi:hypothetical protein
MLLYRRAHSLLFGGYSKALHRRIEQAVSAHEYSIDVISGFRMLIRRTDFFVAEHIERQIHVDSITDPFGEVTTVERTVYVKTTFMLKHDAPQVILLDPPTTSRQVIHKLCGYLEFSVAVIQPEVDLPTWATKMGVSSFQLQPEDVRIQNIDYGDGFTGSLSLSGYNNVLRKAKTVTKGLDYTVSGIGGKVTIDNWETQIRLYRTGRIELSKSIEAEQFASLYAIADW